MKLSSLILILVVMVLNTIPCCACGNGEEPELTQSINKHAGRHENDCTNCSPFYACGNCAASLEIPSLGFTIQQISVTLPGFNEELVLSYANGVNTDVWQPPKVG